MEGIVFVYIFKAISFAGPLNEYSQFACLQQLIRCFLFANVNESFQLMPVFCYHITVLLCTQITNKGYMGGWTSEHPHSIQTA